MDPCDRTADEPLAFEIGRFEPCLQASWSRRKKRGRFGTFQEAKAAFRDRLLRDAHEYLGVARLLDRVQTWGQYRRLIEYGLAGPADADHEAWAVLRQEDGHGGGDA